MFALPLGVVYLDSARRSLSTYAWFRISTGGLDFLFSSTLLSSHYRKNEESGITIPRRYKEEEEEEKKEKEERSLAALLPYMKSKSRLQAA